MSQLISNCCGASPWLDNEQLERCSECLENCSFEEQEQDHSRRFTLGTIASKLFILHRVEERGLASARKELMSMNLPIEDVTEVSQMLMRFCRQDTN
jgi:hypothetical protein